MEHGGGGGQEEAQGSGLAILQSAVDAISAGQWDDLTWILKSHEGALENARVRLEKQGRDLAERRTEAKSVPGSREQRERAKPKKHAVTDSTGAKPTRREELAQNVWTKAARLARWTDRFPFTALLFVQALVVAPYVRALWYSGLIMDDAVAIGRNPNVVAEASLQDFMNLDFWGLPMRAWNTKSFRPLTTLTFRWNYMLLGHKGFHATNVVLHCVASMLVGHTAILSLGMSGVWAVAASVLFGVHPVHSENVLYLVGRADILAAIFALCALNLYSVFICSSSLTHTPLKKRHPIPETLWSCAKITPSVVLTIASGLCKETGFMFFAIMIGMEVLDFVALRDRAYHMQQRVYARAVQMLRTRVVALVVSTILVFVARYRHTGGTDLNMSPQDNPISFEAEKLVRMLSYSFLHGVYMRLLCWPQFLCYDYSLEAIPAVHNIVDCRMLLPVAGYVGVFAALATSLRLSHRPRRAGLVALALLVVPFLPASNILFPVGTVIGERLLYIPSIGFCLWAVLALHECFKSLTVFDSSVESHREPAKDTGRLCSKFCCGLCLVCALLSVRTLFRVRVWQSADMLFLNDGALQPWSAKTQFNLGITHMQNQAWDEAVTALMRCAWADPLSSLPFYRIGQIEIFRGRYASAETFLSAAIEKFGASLMVRDEEVFHDLAVAMFQNGKVDEAETRLRLSLRLNPDFAKGWNNLACCILTRDLESAIRATRKATTLAPDNPQYWANLALLSHVSGDESSATVAWDHALALFPSMPEPRDCTWEFAPA